MGYLIYILFSFQYNLTLGINSAYLQHEAYWKINGIITPVPLNPNGCEGRACPYKTPVGYGFQENAFVSDLPVVIILPSLD